VELYLEGIDSTDLCRVVEEPPEHLILAAFTIEL